MTTPFIVGNWKMNTSLNEAISLAGAVQKVAERHDGHVEVGICPPFPWIVPVREALQARSVRIGAQDVAANANGAFTGDVSATMLAACSDFTLVGHSERRTVHGETDELISKKVRQALDAGLDVLLCVGETSTERNAGDAASVVGRQLESALGDLAVDTASSLTIAYEPVWAIGTGVAATADDAAEMAATIRDNLDQRFGGDAHAIRVLYGGSANDQNAGEFLTARGISGLLVGGASLKPDAFARMIERVVDE